MDENFMSLDEILAEQAKVQGAVRKPVREERAWPEPENLPKPYLSNVDKETVYLPWQLSRVVIGELHLMGIPAEVAEGYTDEATEDREAAKIVERMPVMDRFSPIIVETLTLPMAKARGFFLQRGLPDPVCAGAGLTPAPEA